MTVTPNPSIDRTVEIDHLERGALIRAKRSSAEAAGKGVNVAYALAAHGVATLAILPLAQDSATTYLGLLADAIPIAAVPIAGSIRINVSLVEADRTVTKVNEAGPELGPEDVDAILASATARSDASWIVGCGSLPPGAPMDLYARLVRGATAGQRVAIDSSGEALRSAVCAGAALVKPNLAELEALAGRPLATIGDATAAALELIARGCRAVLLSLGRDGAVFVDGDGATHAEARIDDVANTVGAGDALLAGFLAAGGEAGGLGEAVAWSVAAIRSRRTRMRAVTAADRAPVTVHERIEPSRRLRS